MPVPTQITAKRQQQHTRPISSGPGCPLSPSSPEKIQKYLLSQKYEAPATLAIERNGRAIDAQNNAATAPVFV